MASLIQQRMELDRLKRRWWVSFGLGLLFTFVGVMSIIRGEFDLFSSLQLGGGVFLFALAIFELRRARRAEAAFEAEHGKGAGVQDVIPRSPKR
jgi:hypothetical protein